MATLAYGEKARMYALGKIARGGATRGGYVSARAFIAIDGVHVGFGGTPGAGHVGTIIDSLTVTDALNEAPNTCQFRVNGMVPAAGAAIRVTMGSKNGGSPVFAGLALTVDQRYAMIPRNVQADVHCVDFTWLLGFLKVTEVYRNQSASAIAADLLRYGAANGFTGAGIQPSLPMIDQITFTNEDLDQALTRLAQRIGGYWYVDYNKVVHVFTEETSNGAPEQLTSQHKSLADFRSTVDRTQVLTRVYVEGRGTTVLGAVAAGDTMIPVDAIDMFTGADASVFLKISPHGSDGGAKHVTFAGTVPGQAGSLVGPGVGPPGAPTVARAVGSAGLSTGRYQYAYTDVTPAGETLPSPVATVDVGTPIAPPPTAATITPQTSTLGVDIGWHSYVYTYVTPAGETLAGPPSAAVCTQGPLLVFGGFSGFQSPTTLGYLGTQYTYHYTLTYVDANGGESIQAQFGTIDARPGTWDDGNPNTPDNTGAIKLLIGTTPGTQIPLSVAKVRLYRNQSGVPCFLAELTATPQSGGNTYTDTGMVTLDTTRHPPTVNGAVGPLRYIRVETQASPDLNVTGVKLYRARTDGAGTPFKFVAQVTSPVGTPGAVVYTDAVADANLGPPPPGVDSTAAAYHAVTLSNIAPGPAPTTKRRIYRTAVNGSALKLLGGELADNTTTTVLDTIPDSGLLGPAPTADTSGLQQVAGQVPAGSIAIVVANVAPFESGGGWAVIGNGEQVIRYTGKTGNALTGVPGADIGAIVAAVAFNSTITAAPMVIGIPAAGVWAIREALTAGDDINVVVQCDNTQRQSDLAAMVKVGPGVREEWIQDRRLSITEARARGNATLAARPLEAVTVTYRCRDLRTASGKTITVNLPAPTNVTGTYKIQSVVINKFRPFPTQYPTYTVTATSNLFSFEDWLRRLEMSP